jgi:anti-sigma regulatory factor (Ser/Thr protein kinase)
MLLREAGICPMTPEKPSRQMSPEPVAPLGADALATHTQDRPLNGANQVADLPLIAVYAEPNSPPQVIAVDDYPATENHLPALIDTLAVRAHSLARDQGGVLPLRVFRELVENLVHASFAGVVITILDEGNTVRVSDRGPGIPDKDAAVRRGFTSADAYARRFIRGVGSGFAVIRQTLATMDGALEIEDNLGQGTVVTVRVKGQPNTRLAPAAVPSYNLSERQLKTLLLAVELAPVGPTRIAQELGVSTSTAYRDLVSLGEAGFVTSEQTGRRSVTDVGLAYLDAVL